MLLLHAVIGFARVFQEKTHLTCYNTDYMGIHFIMHFRSDEMASFTIFMSTKLNELSYLTVCLNKVAAQEILVS